MSKTKIKLKSPYNKDWKSGYLNINSDGRRTLALYNSHADRSSTQYSRYLLSVKKGKYLEKNEHVDHIDGDKTNDSLDNLQILSPHENNLKTHKKPDVDLVCPKCGVSFSRSRKFLSGKFDRVAEGKICCSRSCGAKKNIKIPDT